jgi:hypothetical protein
VVDEIGVERGEARPAALDPCVEDAQITVQSGHLPQGLGQLIGEIPQLCLERLQALG